MRVTELLDRAIVRANYGLGLWALDTPFEPLFTTKGRVEVATDSDVSSASLVAMEAQLRRVTAGTRVWTLTGLALMLAGPLSMVTRMPSFEAAVFLTVPFALVAWIAWIVVVTHGWRAEPEWSLADRITVALKRRSLGAEATARIRSMPPDSLLLVAFGSLLSDAGSAPAETPCE